MTTFLTFLLSTLIIFGTGCHQSSENVSTDINEKVNEYIWDREDTRVIPVSFYDICVDMMDEAIREMDEHGDEDKFDYKWTYSDSNSIGVTTVVLECYTGDHTHFISVTIGNY